MEHLVHLTVHYFSLTLLNLQYNKQSTHDFLLLAQPRGRTATRLQRVTLDDIARQAQPIPSIHNTEPITMNDVIIIGGSFAGLAGALQLGRARRKVTVLDTCLLYTSPSPRD